MRIREFDASKDGPALRRCFVELQEVGRESRPALPPGEKIADEYLELMFRRGLEFHGIVLVAIADEDVVGFVSIWTRYRSQEPGDDPSEHGFVSDLVVSSTSRGKGIGRALLQAAEARAREVGAQFVRLSVLSGNEEPISLYASEGFTPYQVYLEKDLT